MNAKGRSTASSSSTVGAPRISNPADSGGESKISESPSSACWSLSRSAPVA
jgi:hypothetical protein